MFVLLQSFLFVVSFGFAGSPFWSHLGALVPPFWHSGNHFGISGAPWDPFWHLGSPLGSHFGTSGPPWRTMGAARWIRDCQSQDFCRFWGILGIDYVSFWCSRWFKISLFLFGGGVSMLCFADFCVEISTSGTSTSWFSHGMYCEMRLFVEIVFNEFLDRFLLFLEAFKNAKSPSK